MAGLVPPGGPEGDSFPRLSPGFRLWLAGLGVPRLIDASLQSLPLSSHGVLPGYLGVSSSCKFAGHIGSGPTLISVTSFYLIISTKTLFPNKITF